MAKPEDLDEFFPEDREEMSEPLNVRLPKWLDDLIREVARERGTDRSKVIRNWLIYVARRYQSRKLGKRD